MSTRRGPWLSGLIVAVAGAVWLIGQVVAGVVSLVSDLVPVDGDVHGAAVSAPALPAPERSAAAARA